jgi:hypothetical protein
MNLGSKINKIIEEAHRTKRLQPMTLESQAAMQTAMQCRRRMPLARAGELRLNQLKLPKVLRDRVAVLVELDRLRQYTGSRTLYELHTDVFDPFAPKIWDIYTIAHVMNPQLVSLRLNCTRQPASVVQLILDNYVFSIPDFWLTWQQKIRFRQAMELEMILTSIYLKARLMPQGAFSTRYSPYRPKVKAQPLSQLQYGGYFHPAPEST